MAPAKKSKRKAKGKPKGKAKAKPKAKPARAKAKSSSKKTAAKKPAPKGTSVRMGGVSIRGQRGPRFDEVLTKEALAFVAELHKKFEKRRADLMDARLKRQSRFDKGELPDFLNETRKIRETDWKIGKLPKDLIDRRVESTGPVDRKMVVNALNSGAEVFMADSEDACSPSWDNLIEGKINRRKCVFWCEGFCSTMADNLRELFFIGGNRESY